MQLCSLFKAIMFEVPVVDNSEMNFSFFEFDDEVFPRLLDSFFEIDEQLGSIFTEVDVYSFRFRLQNSVFVNQYKSHNLYTFIILIYSISFLLLSSSSCLSFIHFFSSSTFPHRCITSEYGLVIIPIILIMDININSKKADTCFANSLAQVKKLVRLRVSLHSFETVIMAIMIPIDYLLLQNYTDVTISFLSLALIVSLLGFIGNFSHSLFLSNTSICLYMAKQLNHVVEDEYVGENEE